MLKKSRDSWQAKAGVPNGIQERFIAYFVVFVGLVSVACGSSRNPAAPSPPPSSPPPVVDTWTLTGQIIDARTQAPIGGASLLTTQTDGSGLFTATGTGTRAAQRVDIAASGYLSRQTTISAGTANPIIDLIPQTLFRPYRELVRNGFQGSGSERWLRWTVAPKFYLNVTVPAGVSRLLESDLVRIEDGIRSAVPAFTGGRLGPAAIVRGTTPPNERGWIVISFINDDNAAYCGKAGVGIDPGRITFNYYRCDCGSIRVRPRTIAHEVGHAMGFWHGSDPDGLMYGLGASGCGPADLSQDERDVARIAYSRPVWNAAPDADPVGTAFTRVGAVVLD